MPRRGRPSGPLSVAATAGRLLGRAAARCYCVDEDDFLQGVLTDDDVVVFADAILNSRVCRRRQRSLLQLREALSAPRPVPWARMILSQAFALYCVFRRSAVPYDSRPDVLQGGGVHLPRRAQRLLAWHGVLGQTISTRDTLRRRAATAQRKLWNAMRGRHCVVWLDNYQRKRFVANPATGYQNLLCSVMSVLNTDAFDMCPRMPTLSELVVGRSRVAQQVTSAMHRLLQRVADVTERTVQFDEIRVPLDVVRQDVMSLQWRPFVLSPLCCTGSSDFVTLLEFLRADVLPHCRSPLPVLVDVNLFYRHVKMCYSKGFLQWRYREHFTYCPALYGVWHSYKQCCILVHRRFHSQLMFLQHGGVRVGDRFPTKPRLRSLELLYAAVLLLPREEQDALRRKTLDRQTALATHVQAVSLQDRFKGARFRMRYEERRRDDARRTGNRREEEALRTAVHEAEAMERLVCGYIPALFVIGWLVRRCNWEGRVVGTARDAQDVVLFCTVLMLSLCGDRSPRTEYLRVQSIALLLWQQWHDGLFGAMFSEEVPEASLGRLGELLHSNPRIVDVGAVEEAFLTVQPGARGVKDVRPSRPSRAFVDMVHGNVRTFIGSTQRVVTYVPWLPEKVCVASADRCPAEEYPPALGTIPSFEGLKSLFGHYLRVLVRSPALPRHTQEEVAALHATLTASVPHRGVVERLRLEKEHADVLRACPALKVAPVRRRPRSESQVREVAATGTEAQGSGRGFRGGRHRNRTAPQVEIQT